MNCEKCRNPFTVSTLEQQFVQSSAPQVAGKPEMLPLPTVCPDCRRQELMAWRNERSLFQRPCDSCKKISISMYHSESRSKVYCQECFWADSSDPRASGRELDFSRDFFPQFAELLSETPVVGLINVHAENSAYCNRIFDGRNNYMSFIALYQPENLTHTYYTASSTDSIDVSYGQKVQLCYELVDAENCYQCQYGNRITDCSDCYFCQDCLSCSNCFGCKNLHQQKYCVFNEQYTKEQYFAFLREAALGSAASVARWREKSTQFHATLPSRAVLTRATELSRGSNLFYTKECLDCFDLYECERLLHSGFSEKSYDSMHIYGSGLTHHSYNSVTTQEVSEVFFCATAVESSELLYCYDCFGNSKNCFGSIGLKKNQYCILNTQYSKDEYEALLPKIIAHMRSTGEWGRFFPSELSPFSYNETTAHDDFPLSRTEALEAGLRWNDQMDVLPDIQRAVDAKNLPDAIADVEQDILTTAVRCETTGRPYRIVKHELEFYRTHSIPLPRKHPSERHLNRMRLRSSRTLTEQACAKCHENTLSSCKPDQAALVYCEECYRLEVF